MNPLLLLALIAAPQPEVDGCLACHGKPLELKLQTGEILSLKVDKGVWAASSHGNKLTCTDCHTDLKDVQGQHAASPVKSKRELAIRFSERCQKCHFQNYTDTLDSVHRARINGGNLDGAVCSDCHGAHDVSAPGDPRTKISQTCSTCHKAIADTYAKSVHGQSLAAGNGDDVPTCTDCHQSHHIADAKSASWRVKSPEMCGTCHTNEKLMKKYRLSTNVLQTYLADFHGVTATLADPKKVEERHLVVTCIDCHGVHDILRVRDPNSPVLKANLVNTCKKCHPDAKPDFPSSWLSHYEASLDHAPLVWLVKMLYRVLIPFMIGGLALQVILHLWRIVVNR